MCLRFQKIQFSHWIKTKQDTECMKEFRSRPLIIFSNYKVLHLTWFAEHFWLLELPLKLSATFSWVWQALPSVLTCPRRHRPAPWNPKPHNVNTWFLCKYLLQRNVLNAYTTNFLADGKMKRKINARIKRFLQESYQSLHCLHHNTLNGFFFSPSSRPPTQLS